jgi:hypothetical protein
MVSYAVWGQALLCCKHARRQQTMTIYSNCWCKLISKHVIVPFAIYCLSLLQVIVILQILYIFFFWFSLEWPVYIMYPYIMLGQFSLTAEPWGWRHSDPLKLWAVFTQWHGIRSQKTEVLNLQQHCCENIKSPFVLVSFPEWKRI